MATIKDVARLAGVGVGTASRVISGNGSVAPATAERVRKVVAQLKFRPSHAARTLGAGMAQALGAKLGDLLTLGSAVELLGLHLRIAERTQLRLGDQIRVGATLFVFGKGDRAAPPSRLRLLRASDADTAIGAPLPLGRWS